MFSQVPLNKTLPPLAEAFLERRPTRSSRVAVCSANRTAVHRSLRCLVNLQRQRQLSQLVAYSVEVSQSLYLNRKLL